MDDLVQLEMPKLINMLTSYLSQEITHDIIYDYGWELVDCREDESAPYDPFWSAVFSVIHYADEEHWDNGTAQRELSAALEKLKQ